MLRRVGDSLTWESVLASWCLGFLVFGFLVSKLIGFLFYWFQSVLVPRLLGFKASKFIGFKASKIQNKFYNVFKGIGSVLPNCHFMFVGRCWSHVHFFHNLLNGSSGLFGARLLQKVPNVGFSKSLRFTTIFCFKCVGLFLDCLRNPGVSNDKNLWFCEARTRPEIWKS